MKNFSLGKLVRGASPLIMKLDALIAGRLVVMASSGGGKSWLLRKLIEIFYGHVQIIVLDPEGEFSSLRKKYDFVVAGKGADVAAVPHLAGALATRSLEMQFNLVVDLYELSMRERILFVRRFLEAMVDAPKNLWHPVLVILDEAHIFAPEQGSAESLQAVSDMASRGRKRGFCLIPATQRMSKFHKDVAAECQNKLIGLANIELDRKRGADELGFTNKADAITLRDLEPGEFYAVGPAFSAKGVNLVAVGAPDTRPAKTGAGKTGTPAPTAKIKAMLAKLADLPKQVEQETLTIKGLQAENRTLKAQKAEAERVIKFLKSTEERKAVNSETMKKAVEAARDLGERRGYSAAVMKLSDLGIKSLSSIRKTINETEGYFLKAAKEFSKELGEVSSMEAAKRGEEKASFLGTHYTKIIKDSPKVEVMEHREKWPLENPELPPMSPYELDILGVLNMKPGKPFSRSIIAAQSGRSKTSSAFPGAIARLVARGLAVRHGADVALAEGVDVSHLVPTGPAGITQWLNKLKGTEKAFLETLLNASAPITKEDLCAQSGRSPSSSGVASAISKLVDLGLAVRVGKDLQLNPEHRS